MRMWSPLARVEAWVGVGEGGICGGGGEIVVLNGRYFMIGCSAEYSDLGGAIGSVEKNVGEAVMRLNCRRQRSVA